MQLHVLIGAPYKPDRQCTCIDWQKATDIPQVLILEGHLASRIRDAGLQLQLGAIVAMPPR